MVNKEALFLRKRTELLETIRHIRRNKGISLAGLSERTGLSKGYISRIESGEVSPGLHNFIRLCIGLGIDLVPKESDNSSVN